MNRMGDSNYVFELHLHMYTDYISGTTTNQRVHWMHRHRDAEAGDETVVPAAVAIGMEELVRIHRLVDAEYPPMIGADTQSQQYRTARAAEVGRFGTLVGQAYNDQINQRIMRMAIDLSGLLYSSQSAETMWDLFSNSVEARLNTMARMSPPFDNGDDFGRRPQPNEAKKRKKSLNGAGGDCGAEACRRYNNNNRGSPS